MNKTARNLNKSLAPLLNEHQVADAIGMSVASVRVWRLRGYGPKYLKIGASVRYKQDDVSKWLHSLPSGGGA